MGWIGRDIKKIKQTEDKRENLSDAAKAYFDNLSFNPNVNKVHQIDATQIRNHIVNYCDNFCRNRNQKFVVDQYNLWLINLVSLYFSKDQRFFDPKFKTDHGLINDANFNKGLFIAGTYGFGKSMIMRAVSKLNLGFFGFRSVSANSVVNQYEINGPKALSLYHQSNIYFDDVGTEEPAMYYGKRVDIFKPILESRYDLYLSTDKLTHLTTNLTPDDIGKRYGERLESRLYEMFNIIIVQGPDRRKTTTNQIIRK